MASRALKRTVTPEDEAERQFGKTYDLAFGFGGGLGAWRRFDDSGTYTDPEVEHFKHEFRRQHPETVKFWRRLELAAHRAVVTGRRFELPQHRNIAFAMENGTLLMTLPSGRRLCYPEAELVPGKFEDTRQLRYKDNARGAWNDVDAWYGVLVENVVQAVARDILASGMRRIEAAGYPIVLSVHDEVVAEIPEGFGSIEEFHRLMVECPPWAEGLPLAAKAWTRPRYAKASAPASEPIRLSPEPAISTPIELNPPIIAGNINVDVDREDEDPDLSDALDTIPLADLIGEPLIGGQMCCPFHDDSTPSLRIYLDHYHCFGCGAHGNQIDWLISVEGMDQDEAIAFLKNWDGPPADRRIEHDQAETNRAFALRLWEQAAPITGTLAARYLAETRGIDLTQLPANIDEVLRFHPQCPFDKTRHPCLLALMRNVVTDEPTGIHRTALTPDCKKIDRRMLGSSGTVKLWPAGSQLVIGEGLETVLAAATRIPYEETPLQPAWAALSADALGRFPILPAVERLLVLIDHDDAGIAAAKSCTARWTRARRTVVQLMPDDVGADFNDLVLAERAS
jgi:hypothetical protein